MGNKGRRSDVVGPILVEDRGAAPADPVVSLEGTGVECEVEEVAASGGGFVFGGFLL